MTNLPQTAADIRAAYPAADQTISRIKTHAGETVADGWRRQDREARGWSGYWHIIADGDDAAYVATAGSFYQRVERITP